MKHRNSWKNLLSVRNRPKHHPPYEKKHVIGVIRKKYHVDTRQCQKKLSRAINVVITTSSQDGDNVVNGDENEKTKQIKNANNDSNVPKFTIDRNNHNASNLVDIHNRILNNVDK